MKGCKRQPPPPPPPRAERLQAISRLGPCTSTTEDTQRQRDDQRVLPPLRLRTCEGPHMASPVATTTRAALLYKAVRSGPRQLFLQSYPSTWVLEPTTITVRSSTALPYAFVNDLTVFSRHQRLPSLTLPRSSDAKSYQQKLSVATIHTTRNSSLSPTDTSYFELGLYLGNFRQFFSAQAKDQRLNKLYPATPRPQTDKAPTPSTSRPSSTTTRFEMSRKPDQSKGLLTRKGENFVPTRKATCPTAISSPNPHAQPTKVQPKPHDRVPALGIRTRIKVMSLYTWRALLPGLQENSHPYHSVLECVKEVLFFESLYKELKSEFIPVNLSIDNQSTIQVIKNDSHIDIKFKFLCEKVNQENSISKYCPTDSQLADIFTKAVSPSIFCKLVRVQRSCLGDHYLIVTTVNCNLKRFIAYKGRRVAKCAVPNGSAIMKTATVILWVAMEGCLCFVFSRMLLGCTPMSFYTSLYTKPTCKTWLLLWHQYGSLTNLQQPHIESRQWRKECSALARAEIVDALVSTMSEVEPQLQTDKATRPICPFIPLEHTSHLDLHLGTCWLGYPTGDYIAQVKQSSPIVHSTPEDTVRSQVPRTSRIIKLSSGKLIRVHPADAKLPDFCVIKLALRMTVRV
ncbi:hypothetical protein PR048_026720 [Dryococelus australis]|uniref:Uncharacterized protein n=1 Tax=Dryococelus australis TaxID=614101 RepID=A0ABQ9GM60_9NEOP|nr:hypothetical protein PR048_026720 [Dryococelus australis]